MDPWKEEIPFGIPAFSSSMLVHFTHFPMHCLGSLVTCWLVAWQRKGCKVQWFSKGIHLFSLSAKLIDVNYQLLSCRFLQRRYLRCIMVYPNPNRKIVFEFLFTFNVQGPLFWFSRLTGIHPAHYSHYSRIKKHEWKAKTNFSGRCFATSEDMNYYLTGKMGLGYPQVKKSPIVAPPKQAILSGWFSPPPKTIKTTAQLLEIALIKSSKQKTPFPKNKQNCRVSVDFISARNFECKKMQLYNMGGKWNRLCSIGFATPATGCGPRWWSDAWSYERWGNGYV